MHVRSRHGGPVGMKKVSIEFQVYYCMLVVITLHRDVVRYYSTYCNTWPAYGRVSCPQAARDIPIDANSGLHVIYL